VPAQRFPAPCRHDSRRGRLRPSIVFIPQLPAVDIGV